MKLDKDGRRADGRHLTYGEYINVPALLASLRVPEEVPSGVVASTWPKWPKNWKPGDAWPRGTNWCHDEALFITTHQAFEVWFRQVLHELSDVLRDAAEIAAKEKKRIPITHLARRTGEAAPNVDRQRARCPRLVAIAEKSDARDLMLFDLPAPASFPAPDQDDGEYRAKLEWFEGRFETWTERVERAAHIVTVCLPFYDVLLHMRPASFLAFRERLAPASGFGSGQFRQIELALGLRERHFAKIDPSQPGAEALKRAFLSGELRSFGDYREEESFARHSPDSERRLIEDLTRPSLRDLVYWLLRAEEFTGKDGARRAEIADRIAAANFARIERDKAIEDKKVSAVISLDVYREMGKVLAHAETVMATRLLETDAQAAGFGPLARLADACLALDNAVLSWRDAHLRFVERVIGARPGTGGGGLKYLRRSVSPTAEPYITRGFPALWDARTALL